MGHLKSLQLQSGKMNRCVYRITAQGRRGLVAAKRKVRELFGELIHGTTKENRS